MDADEIEALARAASGARTTPGTRSLARDIARRYRGRGDREFVQLALELMRRGFRQLAHELFEADRGRIPKLSARDVRDLGAGLGSWGDVDCFAYFVAGPAWREGVISDAHVARWTKSKDHWRRRLALVATVPLNVANRGGSGEAKRTLAVCRALTRDRNPFVVKALSWALRALVTRDRAAVERFLAKDGPHLAALVRREVENKLRTGRKR